MPVTKDQAQMLTSLAIACRPAGARRWDSAGVMAALAKVANRSLPEVIVATIRAASDRHVETPGVIPTAGSHWTGSAVVRTHTPEAPHEPRCTVCGRTAGNHAADHEFTEPRPILRPDEVAARAAQIRATLAPRPAGPTERRSLEDMAEANPELHQHVEAARDALHANEEAHQ
jgi:hypothetical protein